MSRLADSAQTITVSVTGTLLVALIGAFAAWLRSMHQGQQRILRALEGQEASKLLPAVPGLVAEVRDMRGDVHRIDDGQVEVLRRIDRTEHDVAQLRVKVAGHESAVRAWTREQGQVLGIVADAIHATPPPPDSA